MMPDAAPRLPLFSWLLTVATLVAVALATLAPNLTPTDASTLPASWAPAYAANLASDTSAWSLGSGCEATASGLLATGHAGATAGCHLRDGGSPPRGGMQIEVTLAPAADVAQAQQPEVVLNQRVTVSVTQQGVYTICEAPCSGRPTSRQQRVVHLSGSSVAWHPDSYVANALTVRVTASGKLTLFFNGQRVRHVQLNSRGPYALALGAAPGTQALFTHARLYRRA